MSLPLWEELLHSPGVRRWLHRALDGILQSRSLIAVFPQPVDGTRLWQVLRAELWRQREVRVDDLYLPDVAVGDGLVQALARMLGMRDCESVVTEDDLALRSDVPPVIALHDIDGLDAKIRRSWFEFMVRFARASQAAATQPRPPVVVCLARGGDVLAELPETNVRLAVEWWWGMPSAVEMRLLCRLLPEQAASEPHRLWREHLLPALVACDLALAEFIWDHVFSGPAELGTRLLQYAAERGWTADRLNAAGADKLAITARLVPEDLRTTPAIGHRKLWAMGALHYTEEYGIEINSAALSVLGRNEAVTHRVWRGQAALLLPLLDSARLQICTALGDDHGAGWPQKFGLPDARDERAAVAEDPFAAQWGYLVTLFSRVHVLRQDRDKASLAGQAWWIRNELSHYRPIRFGAFEQFWRQLSVLSP